MQTVLTIAGSDTSGGAGIQADIKTIMANGCYAMSAITALTAQNTTGVYDVMDVTPTFLAKQIEVIFQDIKPDAVKIGMVSNQELVVVIAKLLKQYQVTNLVVDPVMVATSGATLANEAAVLELQNSLLPLATIITPNILEAEILAKMQITSNEDMELAATKIGKQFNCAVLCKGGHNINDANDVLYNNDTITWFNAKRVANPNNHGTGCTLSSAIASNLAKGCSLNQAISSAKAYLTTALTKMLDLGLGFGPVDHLAGLSSEYFNNCKMLK